MYMNVQGIRVQDSPGGTVHKNLSVMQETLLQFLGGEDLLEKG